MSEPAEAAVPLRKGWRATWRGDLMRIAGVVSIVVILFVLTWYGQYYLKFLGPPQNCWEYKEMEGKLYKVNPCTGQFQLVSDARAPESGK